MLKSATLILVKRPVLHLRVSLILSIGLCYLSIYIGVAYTSTPCRTVSRPGAILGRCLKGRCNSYSIKGSGTVESSPGGMRSQSRAPRHFMRYENTQWTFLGSQDGFLWRSIDYSLILPRDAAMLARSCESYFCPSVCPSVCHTNALWQKQTLHRGYFATTRKSNHSGFLVSTVVGGRRPFRLRLALTRPLRKTPDIDRFPLTTYQP